MLWADDLLILSDSPEGLQMQLNGLFDFCKHIHMIVNETKTKVMVFGNNCNVEFKYNGKTLEIVNSYKYLGVVVNPVRRYDSNIFSEGFKRMSQQARRAMFKILKDTRHIGMIPPEVAFQLFDALVLPILEYSSEVWFTNKEIPEIEKVQLKYLKIILGVHSNTSNLATYGETGRYPLLLRQKVKAIKYWHRILQMQNDSLVKIVYDNLLSLHRSGFRTWATHIKNALYQEGLGEVWDSQICNVPIVNAFSVSVYNRYQTNWISMINNTDTCPKLRTYCTFKHDIYCEPYLYVIKDFKLRKLLSRFRLSNHSLEIEKGRHQKPKVPAHLRLCKVCKSDVNIENEAHFLLSCPAYDELRQLYFNIRRECGLDCDDFISILNCEITCFYVAKMLQKMFKTRKVILSTDAS